MTEFLARLSSFINLQKAATISVPGLILALAIVVFYFARPVPSLEVATYNFGPAPNLDVPKACSDLSAETAPSSGPGRLKPGDYTLLQQRRQAIDNCVRQLQSRALDAQASSARLAAQIDADQKAADDLMKQYRDYAVKGVDLAAHYQAVAQEKLNAVNGNKARAKESDSRAQIYADLVTRYSQEGKTISDRVHTGENDEPFGDFVQKLMDKALWVMLLGIVLGLALDPITRTVQSAMYNDSRIKRLNRLYKDWRPVPTRSDQNSMATVTTTEVPGRSPRGSVAEASARPKLYNINYALGLGLITEDDLDALEKHYGLSSQFGFGLILPLAVLMIAAGVFMRERLPDVAKWFAG
jgi:hypothetical protein